MTRVAVIDDDAMLREAMAAWFAPIADVAVAGTAATVQEFEAAGLRDVDVILLDLNLRDHSSPAQNVRRLVSAGHRVLMVSTIPDPEHIVATMHAGASGYITKNRDLASLVAMVRDIANGNLALSPELAFALSRDQDPTRPALSSKEADVLRAYAGGMKLEAVARKLKIAPGTARTHLSRIKDKYAKAGRPAYTKLELAQRLREDRLELDGLAE